MKNPYEDRSTLSDGVRDLVELESTHPGPASIESASVIANGLVALSHTAKSPHAHGLLLDEAAASAVRIMADKDFARSFRIMAAR